MSETEIRGRTIGQFPLLDADGIDPATARIPLWREEQPDGNRVAAITPDELKALLVAGGLLTQDAADEMYAPIGTTGNGGDPSNALDPLPAASSLSALRIVSRVGNSYTYSDPSSTNSVWAISGLTAQAVGLGEVFTPVRDRTISDAAWNWELGKPIFLGAAGALTQFPPTNNHLVIVGRALNPQTLFIQIEEPIQL
jgi:hypothetical protein